MSALTVVVRYTLLLERWEIGIDWAMGRTDLVDVGDAVHEGRLADGRVAEIVIDAARPSAMALRRVAAAFGAEVVDLVHAIEAEVAAAAEGGVDSRVDEVAEVDEVGEVGEVGDVDEIDEIDEIERSVRFPDLSPERRSAHPLLPGEAGSVIELPAVPGVPARVEPAVEAGLVVRGPVEVTVEALDAELVIRVRGVEHHDDLWVRVSDGETGTLLAMTRLRPAPNVTSSDPRGGAAGSEDRAADAGRSIIETSAAMTFGLGRSLDELHVSVTDDPLTPVPSRVQRRACWCDELLARARADRLARPGRSRTRAMEAATVAASISDASRYRAAQRAVRAARMATWARVGLVALAIVLVVWLLAGWLGGDSEVGEVGEVGEAGATTLPSPSAPTISAPSIPGAPQSPATPTTATTTTTSPASPTTSPATPTTATTTTIAPPAAVPGETLFGGPATYRFEPEPETGDPVVPSFDSPEGVGEIDLTVFGAPLVRAGSGDSLTVRLGHTFPSVFNNGLVVGSTDSEREAFARQTCLGAVNGQSTENMQNPPGIPRELLVRLLTAPDAGSADGGLPSGTSVVIGSVRIDGPVVSVQSDRRACEENPVGSEVLSTIARYTRAPLETELQIPPDVPPGLWTIELLLDDGRVARVDTPITVRVAP